MNQSTTGTDCPINTRRTDEDYNKIDPETLFTWLWRWLPLRLSKHQSPTTVLFRTLRRMISQDELLTSLCSNHLPNYCFSKHWKDNEIIQSLFFSKPPKSCSAICEKAIARNENWITYKETNRTGVDLCERYGSVISFILLRQAKILMT